MLFQEYKTAILSHLSGELGKISVFAFDSVESTNLLAIEHARQGGAAPALFVSDGQTAGRGRLGRSFISPPGSGIYMTLVIPVGASNASDPVALTAYAAVILSDTIFSLGGVSPKIKWVNDIYLGGKKLAGILAQGVVSPDTGALTHVVIGIGMNVLGEVPTEISEIATTLEKEGAKCLDRAEIIAEITKRFLSELNICGKRECADRYRERSFLVGKAVRVIKPDMEYEAEVVGINDECQLILALGDGTRELLSSGEVSVREKR